MKNGNNIIKGVDSVKKLLIVVDFQNDFVNGSLGFPEAAALEESIYNKILEYNNDEVIYTLDTHYNNYRDTKEGKLLSVPHCIEGTEGRKIYGKVYELLKNKRCFEKNTFPSLELGKYIENKNYDVIELCGLVSSICVLSNAVIAKAACPEAEIIIDSRLTADSDKNMRQKAFDIMKKLHINII